MHDVHSYTFRQLSAILRQSTWTQEHKTSTLIQVLVAQTVIFNPYRTNVENRVSS